MGVVCTWQEAQQPDCELDTSESSSIATKFDIANTRPYGSLEACQLLMQHASDVCSLTWNKKIQAGRPDGSLKVGNNKLKS